MLFCRFVLSAFCAELFECLFSEILFWRFLYRFARQSDAEFLEDSFIDIAHHDSYVDLASSKVWQLLQCCSAVLVGVAEDGEGDEHLVSMQPRITAPEIACLCLLYRLYHALRDEFHVVVDAGKMFHRVEQEGSGASEQRPGL